jgi:hypothetical protein
MSNPLLATVDEERLEPHCADGSAAVDGTPGTLVRPGATAIRPDFSATDRSR